jgi:hypothetical protein
MERTAGGRQCGSRHDGRLDDASGDTGIACGTGIADSARACGTFHDTIRLKKPPRTSRSWRLPVSEIISAPVHGYEHRTYLAVATP